MAEEITKLRQKEEQLKIAETKLLESEVLKVVLQNAPFMIFVKDKTKDLSFVLLNRAGEKLLGVKEKDFLGKNDYNFFPKDQADFFVKNDNDVFKNKEVLKIEQEEISTPLGKRILNTSKIPVFDETGTPHYLIGISNDVTDDVQAKKELESERLKSFHVRVIRPIFQKEN